MGETPRRLLESSQDDLELELLRAGASEVPSDGARARLLASMGMVAAGSAVAATGAAGVGASAAATKTLVTKLVLLKWLVATAIVAGGASVVVRWAAPSPAARSSVSAPAHMASAVSSQPPAQVTPHVDPVLEPEPIALVPPEKRPAPAVSAKKTLSEETAVLDRAREKLDAGDPASALAILNAHDRDFKDGVLRPEATALRVAALAKSGDHAKARALGESFLATHPTGAAARRVRAVLEQLGANP